MATRDGFRRAIADEPDDDSHRLVFADWLDDNGEPERAELIRIQCELARGVEDGERLVTLSLRERELLIGHWGAWLGALDQRPWKSPRFERGMVQLSVNLSDFLKPKPQTQATEWFPRACVTGLTLRNHTALPGLYRCPLLAELSSLSLWNPLLDDEGIRQLAQSGGCCRLRSFFWRDRRGSDEGLRHLAGSPSFGRLNSLTLGQIPFRSAGLKALLDSPHCTGLTALAIRETSHWMGDLPGLMTAAGWQRLLRLDLHDLEITGRQLRRMAEGGRLRQLKELRIWYPRSDALGSFPLAELAALEVLDFGSIVDSIQLSRVMATLDSLPALRRLSLQGAPFLGSLPGYLPHLARLESLELHYCGLKEADFRALLAAPELLRLRRLALVGVSRHGDLAALLALVGSAQRPELRELILKMDGDNEGLAQAVLGSGGFPSLLRLRLGGSALSDEQRAKLQQRYPRTLIALTE
jgi:uncharacterized protein (TIGR02996 family)